MLKGISPAVSPELLMVLSQMGHGDEIILADAHFPGTTLVKRAIRADGLPVTVLLEGILPLFELDSAVRDRVVMMAPMKGDKADPAVARSYRKIIDRLAPGTPPITYIDRFAFYDRARNAFAVVMSGETARYANIILKKEVTPQQKGKR